MFLALLSKMSQEAANDATEGNAFVEVSAFLIIVDNRAAFIEDISEMLNDVMIVGNVDFVDPVDLVCSGSSASDDSCCSTVGKVWRVSSRYLNVFRSKAWL